MAGRMSEMNDLTTEGYAVLVVVQAGRGAYDTGQCPTLKSAQYSSAIEQYASTVLGLWRNRASERFVRPIKNRFPVDAMYRRASLRIVVEEDERLKEGLLEFGNERQAPEPKLSPVLKVLTTQGAMSSGGLVKAVRDIARRQRPAPRTVERWIAQEKLAGSIEKGEDGLWHIRQNIRQNPATVAEDGGGMAGVVTLHHG